jgi:choline dehydrogenase-like flavoprotein
MSGRWVDRVPAGDLRAEVCVVGSGAGGGCVAAELAEGGRDVVILEEGPYYETSDFTMDAAEMILRLYRDAGTSVALGVPNINFIEACCVGGTTVINGGMCWRTPERVLKRWSWEHGVQDLEPERLRPYFEKVEERIHVAYQDPESVGRDSQLLKLGAERLGYRIQANRRNQDRCTGANNCPFGCPTGAKQSTLVTYVPRALAAGARLFPNCRAERVLVENDRAVGVEAVLCDRERGEVVRRFRVRADRVIVSAGATQSPLLLLRSGIRRRGDWTGRNLLLHPNVKVVGIFDEPVEGWRGVSQAYQITEFAEEGLLMAETFVPPGALALALPFFGREAAELFERYNNMVITGVLVEDTTTGRVRLLGGRRPVITYFTDRKGLFQFRRGAAPLSEVLFAAGAREVILPFHQLRRLHDPGEIPRIFDAPITRSGTDVFTVHLMGTCRMGGDPRRSVVDSYGRHHLVRDLHVCDASLFPTPIGVNPQVTIMMLATRMAEYILDRWH